MNQTNETLAKRWYDEVWNEKRAETIYELLAPEGISYLEDSQLVGPAQFQQYHSEMIAMFPDIKVSIDEIVSDDETVAVRWTANGTHTGAGYGLEPTGKNLTIRGITWLHIENGKIVEGWDAWNRGGLLMALNSQ